PEMFSDKVSVMEELTIKFSKAIEKIINIRAAVRLMPPNSIPRSEGKAKRVVDKRELDK
ncbi:MAG: phenylacetate--CoA ligase, partial [Lentisphaeria bacterium]|nr:phenylacetate--CoA ligase [Lentisphaeria bacterium]